MHRCRKPFQFLVLILVLPFFGSQARAFVVEPACEGVFERGEAMQELAAVELGRGRPFARGVCEEALEVGRVRRDVRRIEVDAIGAALDDVTRERAPDLAERLP